MKGKQAIGRSCVSLNLRRAARLVSRRYDEALRPLGITIGQFSLLGVLAARREASISAVAAFLGMDRTTLTRNLRPLQARGLVNAKTDPEDGRSRIIFLSSAGQALFEKAVPLWETAQKDVLKGFGKGEWPRMQESLSRLGAQ